ncbi:hypothetical protein ACMA5I_05390 [Paracoccaceae bacterium GXU_MW_L88]
MNNDIYLAFSKALRIERSDIFGSEDQQMPISEPLDAIIPQAGFVGRDYQKGGTVLLGINPGGGGDTYIRTAEDADLLPLIERCREGEASLEETLALCEKCATNMQTWNLWRIVEPVLQACGENQSEIAYLNWCPFRTRSDKMPHAHVMRRCREVYLLPIIDKLAPSRIIALGKKVGAWLEKEPIGATERYIVPRTIGDSYLSAEATEVLADIARSSN